MSAIPIRRLDLSELEKIAEEHVDSFTEAALGFDERFNAFWPGITGYSRKVREGGPTGELKSVSVYKELLEHRMYEKLNPAGSDPSKPRRVEGSVVLAAFEEYVREDMFGTFMDAVMNHKADYDTAFGLSRKGVNNQSIDSVTKSIALGLRGTSSMFPKNVSGTPYLVEFIDKYAGVLNLAEQQATPKAA